MHVGAGDGVGRGGLVEDEGDDVVLDQVRVLDGAEDAETEELSVDGLGVEPLLLQDLGRTSRVLVDSGAPDGDSERGVDGVGLGILDPSIKALKRFLDNPTIISLIECT